MECTYNNSFNKVYFIETLHEREATCARTGSLPCAAVAYAAAAHSPADAESMCTVLDTTHALSYSHEVRECRPRKYVFMHSRLPGLA